MKIHDILTEKKTTVVSIMYHGTSDIFARQIMKTGLLANPPKRTYDDDHVDAAMKTFGGVYLTPKLSYANAISDDAVESHGGKPLLITLQFAQGSADVDEDLILDHFEKAVISYHLHQKNEYSEIYQDTQEEQEFHRDSIVLEFKQFARDMFSYMSTGLQSIGRLGNNVPSVLLKLAQLVKKYVQKSDVDIMSFLTQPRMYLRNYPGFQEIIEELMRNIFPRSSSATSSAYALRLNRDVGFRGKTKIIKIDSRTQVYYQFPEYDTIMLQSR